MSLEHDKAVERFLELSRNNDEIPTVVPMTDAAYINPDAPEMWSSTDTTSAHQV